MLCKTPVFTAVAVLSLALSIGAGTAVFSIVNAVLLSSLPVPNPQELRLIKWSGTDWESNPNLMLAKGIEHSGQFLGHAVSLPVLQVLRQECSTQADIFAYCPVFEGRNLRGRHEAVWTDGLMVSGNFFSGVGVRPAMGHLLGSEDERIGAVPVIVISYRLWEQQFALDPGVIGESVTLGGFSFTIVGVLPKGFRGVRPGANTDFYVPLAAQSRLNWKMEPDAWCAALMARLKPGVSDAQFQSALNVAFAREAATVMRNPKVWITAGHGGTDEERNHYGGPLRLLLGVVGLVLLVASTNLAGLLLARSAGRQHEFALRAALGAPRRRLIRQSLTESALLTLFGSGLGLVIALWGKAVLGHLLARSAEGLHYDTSLDLTVLSFTVGISLVTVLLSGLWPAVRAARVDPLAGLKDRGTLGAPRLRASRSFVAAQIGISLLLVAGACLFVQTLINLTHVKNIGYDMDHLLVFKLQLDRSNINPQTPFAFFERIRESLAAIPGVRSAAFSAWPAGDYAFKIPGNTSETADQKLAHVSFVNETFFTTMGIPLLLGRQPQTTGGEQPKAVVVNEAFVRRYLAGRNPIGLTIKLWGNEDLRIVGVCRDAKYMDMHFRQEVTPMVHLSSSQTHPRVAQFVLRTTLPPLTITRTVHKTVAASAPNVPLTDISTQEQLRDAVINRERALAALCSSLAVLAVLLSAIGLYGLMSYQVTRRTGELGIRQALGATRWQIACPIVREALVLTGLGIAIGLLLTLPLMRLLSWHFYGVGPADPLTLCGAAILFLVVALFAAWLPAWRATRIDPMVALRSE
jgi:predicted permease